ncbi:hypothetical protein [Couchioplanes azureus]|uniref:hypothetical protein n=1 Tax=Couchioplanes caeruleus TaxID=56438 RepID=UPI00167127C4|nr:hypothetical protein [Couchioplanes caeruleus]GGQ50347.1 hypothetical protein GCM10010166_18600 [Couchioplanes caeruleus subsp. azureus]
MTLSVPYTIEALGVCAQLLLLPARFIVRTIETLEDRGLTSRVQLTVRIALPDYRKLSGSGATHFPFPLLLRERDTVINHLQAWDHSAKPLAVIERDQTEEIMGIVDEVLKLGARTHDAQDFYDTVKHHYSLHRPVFVDLPRPESPLFMVSYSRKRINSQGTDRHNRLPGRSGERWKRYQVPLSLSARSQSYHLRIEETEDRFLSEFFIAGTERTRCGGPGDASWEICLPQRHDEIAACQRTCRPECFNGPYREKRRLDCTTSGERRLGHVTQFGSAFAHLYIPAPADGPTAIDTPDGPRPWRASTIPAGVLGSDNPQAVVYFDEVPPGSTSAIAMMGCVVGLIALSVSAAGTVDPKRVIWNGFAPMIIAMLPLFVGVLGLSADRLQTQSRNNAISLRIIVVTTLVAALFIALAPQAHLWSTWLNVSLLCSIACFLTGAVTQCRVWAVARRYRRLTSHGIHQVRP